MKLSFDSRQHYASGIYALRWFLIVTPVAALIGSVCAAFLWALDCVTKIRIDEPWLLYLLPIAGIAIVAMYQQFGKGSERGNDLLFDAILSDKEEAALVERQTNIPSRMGVLIFLTTIITHLFGGSAGREGTAVQMGGSIAATFGGWFKLSKTDLRLLLMAGIAAGFGGVFGTPLTGAIFAMEVLALGKISYEGVIPCLIGAIVGDYACSLWGVQHAHYQIAIPKDATTLAAIDPVLALKVAIAAIFFGLAGYLFAWLTHRLNACFNRIPFPLMRPVAGASLVIILTLILGTRDYLGLGTLPTDAKSVTLSSCFVVGGVGLLSWWWKLLFTSITLSCGFKGGEVTPLFFIGAALGNVIAGLLGVPVDLFAGLGFISVFAAATNAPLACTIMGIELFGAHYTIYFVIACFSAYLWSGRSGIYASQLNRHSVGEK
jgi:H+/Cl- antiporter ClcA